VSVGVTVTNALKGKVCTSLYSALCGWAAGAVSFSGYALIVWRRLDDIDSVIGWTLPFVLAGWLFFFLPIVLVIDGRRRLFRFPEFMLVGAIVGLAAFMLLVGWWTSLWRQSYVYLVDAGVTGAVAGMVYSRMSTKASGEVTAGNGGSD